MEKRVLILHDDPEARSEYCKILWYNGFDVELADDAEQARRVAEMRAPDLVLLGISGASTRGFELCRELGHVPGASIPVMLLSRHLDPDRVRAARRAGCSSYLEEPMPPVEVLFAVERLIGRSVPDELEAAKRASAEPGFLAPAAAGPGSIPPAPIAAVPTRHVAGPPDSSPPAPAEAPLHVVVDPAPAPPLHAIETPGAPPASGSEASLVIEPMLPTVGPAPEALPRVEPIVPAGGPTPEVPPRVEPIVPTGGPAPEAPPRIDPTIPPNGSTREE